MQSTMHIPRICRMQTMEGKVIEEGKVIAQGRRDGRMFILETNEVGTAMFAKGQKVESDIDLWHKRFNHVNFPPLREM